MIDPRTETIVPLAQLSESGIVPRVRRGQDVHLSTLYRWAGRGFKNIRLETIRVGGTLCTSIEAFARFCAALSDETDSVPKVAIETGKWRLARAERELSKVGF